MKNKPDLREIEVIAPNLKRRLSGVTATIARLVPVQVGMINVVATGPGLPEDMPHIPLWRAMTLPNNRWRVWHARRNNEMLLGLIARHILRRKFRLVFTSASQRHHTRYTKFLISRMDRVISTSARTAAYLERPSDVILHGIDTSGFNPARDRDALRKSLGLPGGMIIGCFGRIRAQKGTDVFVRAMLPILKKRPDVTALVLGRATEQHQAFQRELEALVAEHGLKDRVMFPGEVPVEQIAGWYQALDLYVAPQRWEGFGLTPIEAMACGVPVVATRVGAFEEQIVEGETGFLIDPGIVEQMETAIETFLDDRALLVGSGKNARAHVLSNFQIQREAAEIVDVYRALLR